MNPFLERSVFLRTLNFLRVKHDFAFTYNLLYPLILTILFLGVLISMDADFNVYGEGGLLSKLSPFLAIFAPFFLAALAAISTFSGPRFLDKKFDMASSVTLEVSGARGFMEPMEVTPRHFLSLLFGYCCVVSLFLFLLSALVPLIAGSVGGVVVGYKDFISILGLGIYLFLFFQVILLTLLGIYYLSDKIHREG